VSTPEQELTLWRLITQLRDPLICSAHRRGMTKHRIYRVSGVSRPVIDRALASQWQRADLGELLGELRKAVAEGYDLGEFVSRAQEHSMSGNIATDAYGHEIGDTTVIQLTAGAVGTNAVGTIAGTAAAGAAPTVTIGDCTDRRGNFLLNPVTGGGAQAAGAVALIKFARPYARPPGLVMVDVVNETDGNLVASAAPLTVTGDGWSLVVGAALTTAKAYRVNYLVVQ